MDKKILFVLDKDLNDYTALGYSYIRAFKKLGYNCDIAGFSVNLKIYGVLKYWSFLNKLYLIKEQSGILRSIEESDAEIVFVIKGYYLKPETLIKIKKSGKFVFCFNPDDPFSSIVGSSNLMIKNTIPLYNAYFIWHQKLIQPLKDAGCKNVFYMPFAADTDIMKLPDPVPEDNPYAVSFIGNADSERKQFIRELSLKLSGTNERMALFGRGWNNIQGFECYAPVLGKDYLKTIYRSNININILRKQNKGAHNMRTFEIPATGGFLLHEHSPDVEEFFQEGIEMEFFRDAEECKDKIEYYIKNDDIREKIAFAGYKKIISADYTYNNLVKQIEEKIESLIQ